MVNHGMAHCSCVFPHSRLSTEFQLTIEPGFWKLPHAWTRTESSMVYPTFEQEDSFSEELSDLCLVQLLGTGWVPWTCLTS